MSDDNGGPAFPSGDGECAGSPAHQCGMSLREYAAIHLRVPMSDCKWLDDMIREAMRNELAGQAMKAITISEVLEAFRRNDYDGRQPHNVYVPCQTFSELANAAYGQADAMLREGGTQ